MFQSRKESSKAEKDVLKQFMNSFEDKKMPFSFRFVPKSVQSAIAHRTPDNEPHARTSRTLFRMDFARTRTFATQTLHLVDVAT